MIGFLPFTVGLRFSRAKKKTVMSGVISAASIAGITLGAAALITGLSAMNGFEREVAHRVLGVMPAVEVTSLSGYFDDAPAAAALMEGTDRILAASPGMIVNAMLNSDNRYRSSRVTALDSGNYKNVINIDEFMLDGVRIADLKDVPEKYGVPGIIVGYDLAKKLKVKKDDSVELIVTRSGADGALSAPAGTTCRVAGIFRIGGKLDGLQSYADLDTVRRLAGLGPKQSASVFLKTGDFFGALADAREELIPLAGAVPEPMGVQSWMDQAAPLYRDIQMVRTVMCLALLLVIVVSCFNIVSSLIMSVNEKRSEVAILLSMGYSRFRVMCTFVVQGLFSGAYGTVFGVFLGLLLASNLTETINFIQDVTGARILRSETYFIDYVPSEVRLSDVLLTASFSLFTALLAAALPGIRASFIRPAAELSLK